MENISAAATAKNEDNSLEGNPLDDILSKYPTLCHVLITLLTDHYKEYLNGVYIVAPKPTTFKVVLHNNQEFYLEYTGKTYQAKVAGRRYYLLNIGEEQQAVKAIANLLTLGKPKENIPEAEEVENEPSSKDKPKKKTTGIKGGGNTGYDPDKDPNSRKNQAKEAGGEGKPGEESPEEKIKEKQQIGK